MVMKQNFTTTISYFIYLAMAILMHPANNFLNNIPGNCTRTSIVKESRSIAVQKAEVLHSELLFKY
jgi:hypothetical protein